MIAWQLNYEAMPAKKYKIIEGVETMSKKEEVPVAKVYEKSRTEHFKDIVIAVLVTAVVCFVGGVSYANAQHNATETKVQSAVEAVETTVKTETATVTPKG